MNGGRLSLLLVVAIVVLLGLNLAYGPVDIPLRQVIAALLGDDTSRESWRFIVVGSRLPQALTAIFAGGALAVCGLMLQTAFRNPLADPYVFGINSGAGVGVALVMLLFNGSLVAGSYTFTGFLAVLLAAFAGAMAVMVLIFFFSTLVSNNVMLLIVGIMIGYLASSAITILNFMATEEGVKSYMVWGMGNFGGVSMRQMPLFASFACMGLIGSLLLIKPLNALMLGERYAENLGVSTRHVRNLLLILTGLLTAIVTAFCGPISFIGLAVPHITRLLTRTDNHRTLIPTTLLCGAVVALLCNLACTLPGDDGIIPLNAVTPLVGAPVVIYVIVKSKGK